METQTIDFKAVVTDQAILRQVSRETTAAEVDKMKLLSALKYAISTAWCHGYGLAAIQIGVPLRYAWYRMHVVGTEHLPQDQQFEDKILINPVIIERRKGFVRPNEGCLSIPNQYFHTNRFMEIVYENNGVRGVASGLEAVIIQHEVDHMDGALIFDRRYEGRKVGRNEECPCGSHLKFKKCCGVNL